MGADVSKSKTPMCPYCGKRHRIWADRAAHPDCYRAHRRIYYHEVLKSRKDQPKPPPLPDGHKRCTGCGRVLALERFYRCRGKRDSHMARCKECEQLRKSGKPIRRKGERRDRWNAYQREYRRKNRDQLLPKERVWRKKWRLKRVLKGAAHDRN